MNEIDNLDDAEFARRVRMARAYLGLTLKEAGAHLGISASQLSARENAEKLSISLRPADRLYMATVYCRLTGWPESVFTEQTLPRLARYERGGDDLEPEEVVDLIEGDQDDGEGLAEPA